MRTQAIDFMHENIEKFEKEAEDELSTDQLLAHQLTFTAEGEDKCDSYLKALRQAEKHLEVMRLFLYLFFSILNLYMLLLFVL